MSDNTTQLVIGGVLIGVTMLIVGAVIYYTVLWIESNVDDAEEE